MKYSGIGDLIDENIELKSKIKRMKKEHLKCLIQWINLLTEQRIKDFEIEYNPKEIRGYNIKQIIKGFEEELKDLE